MKFTTNTKPLAEALNLGIIDSNISNYYKRSSITQVSATNDTLKINVESSMICTEITLKGVGEGEPATAFVDSSLFKKLIHTLEANVTFEFDANGLKIKSGNSKFSLGNNYGDTIDVSEFSLNAPMDIPADAEFVDIDNSDWKFIKDNQMFAVSKSFTLPMYTKVWIGEHGDVLTGDFDLGLFTYSKKNKLGTTCLLSDTIINLFNTLPEGATLAKVGKDYVIKFFKDAYTYVTQFTPQYESDEGVGDYKSNMLIEMLQHPEKSVKVFTGLVVKSLNQAILLSSNNNSYIDLSVRDGNMYLNDANVHSQIVVEGEDTSEYAIKFKLPILKQIISSFGDRYIEISPIFKGDTAVGILVWDDDLTIMFAGAK